MANMLIVVVLPMDASLAIVTTAIVAVAVAVAAVVAGAVRD